MNHILKLGGGTAEFTKTYDGYIWKLRDGYGRVVDSGEAHTLRQCILESNFCAKRRGWIV